MYILPTEKITDKTVVRGAKFENRNLMRMKSTYTYVMRTVRVMCVICYVTLSFIYFQNKTKQNKTQSVVVSLSTAAATGCARECRLSMR